MKRAVIYARYSCDNQTEQSIEGQLRVCLQYAQNNDILILDTYIDRAMTGTNDNRPDFQRMIKDSSKKEWDFVIVYKLDRFSRNKYEATVHKKTLKDNGVKVLSAMENIPDSPEGIILESLLEGMNQYYSAELSQKVHRGLIECYLKGHFTGGAQLFGYDTVDKKVVINNEEANIVREIFADFAHGFTGADIVKKMESRGVKTKQGKFITKQTIYNMLSNTKYIGIVEHNGTTYTNIYPAIVDEQTWKIVQNIRHSYKHSNCRKHDVYNYILSGKTYCGYCKNKVVGYSAKEINKVIKYRYYICSMRRPRKKGETKKCILETMSKAAYEKEVLDITWKVLSNNNLELIADNILKYHENELKIEAKLTSLENQKTALVKSSNNLISALEQGIITEQTKNRLKQLEIEILKIEFEIEQEKQKESFSLTKEMIIDYFKKVISGDIENIEIQKMIVKTFIREILVYNDKIIIAYNFTSDASITSLLDDIEELENKAIETQPLFDENDINKKADLSFFCNNHYFAVVTNRPKKV